MQGFIYLDLILFGVVVTIAIRHARAHYRPSEHDRHSDEKPKTDETRLPPVVREELLHKAETRFSHALDRSSEQLEEDLKSTTEGLTKKLDKLGSELIDKELARYSEQLAKLKEQTEGTTQQAKTELESHQSDIKAKLQAELEAEKKRTLEQIDAKLTDAVMSFILETLQHNIDLGAQGAYLTSMLDEHKEEFKRGVADEAPTTG